MHYFDTSVYYNKSSSQTKTYNSYMCRSKDSYIINDDDDYNGSNYNGSLWNNNHIKNVYSKPAQVSKLRHILSETISNITKDNKLKQGESVELTLEIEMMKTEKNTPSNSLVEVTIIQHNKAEDKCKDSLAANRMPFELESKSSVSETASQKRRNWFQRVISKQYEENTIDKCNDYTWKMKGDPVFCMNEITTQVHNNTANKNPRSNFITILPDDISFFSGDYTKGYRRVSPNKKNPVEDKKYQKPRNIMTTCRKDSFVRKLSDVFLPSQKADKKKAVKSALTALKNEVDNMKLVRENGNVSANSRKRKRAPVHNLGKLVSNILVDMMEHSENNSTDKKENNSFPVQYQSFFEPVTKTNKHAKTNKRIVKTLPNKNTATSHSDTCCLCQMKTTSGPVLKMANSMGDCRANVDVKLSTGSMYERKLQKIPSKKKHKTDKIKHLTNHRKNTKSNIKTHLNHKVSSKKIHNSKRNKKISSKHSTIQWNGQTLQVNKEIKSRIEMLIVNELQNLALKEGMECDVKPLSPTENTTKHVDTISSFVCELDISDKKFKKVIKNVNSSNSKEHEYQSTLTKTDSSKFKLVGEDCTRMESDTKNINKISKGMPKSSMSEKKNNVIFINSIENVHQTMNTNCNLNSLNKDKNHQAMEINCNLISPDKHKLDQDEMKVTYLNENIINWSAESRTVIFENPINNEIQIKKIRHNKSPVFEFCGKQKHNNVISSNFVKKIKSDDSTWKKFLSGDTTENSNSCREFSKQFLTVASTITDMKFNSLSSNDCDSTIEIEINIKDLEVILKEAKEKQNVDKVLISAKCKREKQKPRKSAIKFTGKNSPSYTNQLLSTAARKLEKYIKIRR